MKRVRSKGAVTIESATEEQIVIRLDHSGSARLPYEFVVVFGDE